MRLKLEEDIKLEDIEVLIRYARITKKVNRIVSLLKSADSQIKCSSEKGEILINASDIYYIESVDKKTFVYCEKKVYPTEFRLYQLREELLDAGFAQVSKACILNLNVLESIKPLFNSRLEATLTNCERINVTRKYLPEIKKKIKER
ncbi:MAG: LytTR family DNA-binding domain-containing protein [Anaerovoracaceae bacterium]